MNPTGNVHIGSVGSLLKVSLIFNYRLGSQECSPYQKAVRPGGRDSHRTIFIRSFVHKEVALFEEPKVVLSSLAVTFFYPSTCRSLSTALHLLFFLNVVDAPCPTGFFYPPTSPTDPSSMLQNSPSPPPRRISQPWSHPPRGR